MLDALAALRASAWAANTSASAESWLDDWDTTAHHHIIMREGKLAAAFRFTLHDRLDDLPHRSIYGQLLDHLPTPIAWFSRLVVAPDWRGKGLSRSLDFLATNEPFTFGANSIVATGGSVTTNRFRHEVMLKHGWKFMGQAAGLIDLPISGATPPAVYARQRVAK